MARPVAKVNKNPPGSNYDSIYDDIFRQQLFNALNTSNLMLYIPDNYDRMNLATTYVSLHKHEYDIPVSKGGKNTIYILSSEDDLIKRAGHIVLATNLKVGCFIEHFKHDVSSKEMWTKHQDDYQILLMSPAIYLNALQKRYVTSRTVNIFIFDDCLHTESRATMGKIMTDHVLNVEIENRPRALALARNFLESLNFIPSDNMDNEIAWLEAHFDAQVIITKECYNFYGTTLGHFWT